jgi:hypothetical protein
MEQITGTRRARDAGVHTLGAAVRRALGSGARLVACGLAFGSAATAQAAAFPAVFPLARLLPNGGGDGSAGFVLRGINSFDQSGISIGAAGDINGDGRDDLLIGAISADRAGLPQTGESYVVFGAASGFPAAFELSSLLPQNGGDGSAGVVFAGIDAYDFAGRSVSAAGDINGDGIDDLVVGADFADPDGRSSAGECYVIYGRDTAQAGNFPARIPLQTLFPAHGGDGSVGFVLTGVDAFDQLCHSVSAAGDVNGDGIGDLLIGAFGADPTADYAGESYVVYGRNAAQAGAFPAIFSIRTLLPVGGGDGSAGFAIVGVDLFDQSGISVSGAGYVNGDGVDDVLIGARLASPGGRAYAGESFVVFGRNTAETAPFPPVFPLASLLPTGGGDGSTGFVITGIAAYDFSGAAVKAAGDVNGDGVADIIIGAYRHGPGDHYGAGASYVVFGRDTLRMGDFPAVVPLANLLPAGGGDGTRGFVIDGIDPLDSSGFAVSGAGYVNGDGVDDLAIGAPLADGGDKQNAGEGYVVFGRDPIRDGRFPPLLPLATLMPAAGGDGSHGFVLVGARAFDYAGYAVSSAGDMNGDGVGDLFISAKAADPSVRDYAGESYVVYGRTTVKGE